MKIKRIHLLLGTATYNGDHISIVGKPKYKFPTHQFLYALSFQIANMNGEIEKLISLKHRLINYKFTAPKFYIQHNLDIRIEKINTILIQEKKIRTKLLKQLKNIAYDISQQKKASD